MDFIISNVGYNYQEDRNFVIDRPEGSSDFLFLYFSTGVQALLNGVLCDIPANSCLIYTPTYPQYYCNAQSGFVNDWFHFNCENGEVLISDLGLPLNTPFSIDNYSFIRVFVKELSDEFIEKDALWELNINHLLYCFFIKLSRANAYSKERHINPYKSELFEKFKQVRLKVLNDFSHQWSIEEMSSLIGLSRSRFTVLYGEFFNCSPKEDLITERITRAKYLLSTNTFSVSEVAGKVGYDNIYHFCRQFKKYTGVPPGKWK